MTDCLAVEHRVLIPLALPPGRALDRLATIAIEVGVVEYFSGPVSHTESAHEDDVDPSKHIAATWSGRQLIRRLFVVVGVVDPILQTSPDIPPDARAEYLHLVNQLERSILRERLRATRLLAISVIGGLGAIYWLYLLSKWGLQQIVDASEMIKVGTNADGSEVYSPKYSENTPISVTAFLLVRGIAYSGVVGGFLFGLFRLARSAMDQATRFDKRLIALHFIRFATGAEDRLAPELLPLVVDVLKAWSATVDSAYTQNPGDSRAPSNVKVEWDGKKAEMTGPTE